jgi:hypothetical protein
MTETPLGRLLAACLHQAVADELPQRLDFYEHWLHSEGLRDGTIGMAPISAVLGFLRAEGQAYDQVVARAGVLAADWWVASLPPSRRRLVGWLPRPLRIRAVLRIAGEIACDINRESEVRRKVRKSSAEWRLTSSVFCSVRAAQPVPLCGFYVALVVQTFAHFGFAATGRTAHCRAMEGASCVLAIELAQPGAQVSPPAIAA